MCSRAVPPRPLLRLRLRPLLRLRLRLLPLGLALRLPLGLALRLPLPLRLELLERDGDISLPTVVFWLHWLLLSRDLLDLVQ